MYWPLIWAHALLMQRIIAEEDHVERYRYQAEIPQALGLYKIVVIYRKVEGDGYKT